MSADLHRLVEPLLDELLAELPAVLIVGPRAVGKTTLALARAASVLRLDVPADAAAVRLDPDAALASRPEPVLIDEWQVVPEVLAAVKRSVDADPRPGRFILTGSVAAGDLDWWAGTGRIVTLPLWGLSVAERRGSTGGPTFLDRIVDTPSEELQASMFSRSQHSVGDYLDLAFESGFPRAALSTSRRTRALWLSSYLDQLVLRDVASIGSRNPTLLRRYVQVLALNSAGVATQASLVSEAQVNRLTAVAYEDDLQRTYTLELVPPWHSNRLSRLAKLPKRYLTDSALIPAALGLDERAVLGDPDLIGRMLDTFVAAELRTQASLRLPMPRLHHLRDQDGRHEVDLVLESSSGLVAFELKATAAPTRRDARHLEWLTRELGDTVHAAVLLTAGPQPVQLADRVIGLPISALWDA